MEIFNRVVKEIEKNRLLREEGLYTCIPWVNLPKFSTVIPGIEKSRYTICSANSKVGKTQIADYLYLYQPYEFVTTHKSNIKIKILYFSLEIGKNAKMLGIISNKLYTTFGLTIDPQNLLSKFGNFILPKEHEDKIKGLEVYFEEFEKTVTIIDSIRNAFGIYKYCRDWFEKNGTIHYKTVNFSGEDHKIMDYYEPTDPDLYTLIIIDNYNLLTPEKGMDLKGAIEKFSSDYALTLRDKFGAHVIAIQQQMAAREQQEYTKGGGLLEQKLRPSADGLGDSKLSGRDCDYLIGLFAPSRFNIPRWANYDINRLGDNHRELSLSLNRHGSGFKSVQLYFNGAVNHFSELEAPEIIKYEKYNK